MDLVGLIESSDEEDRQDNSTKRRVQNSNAKASSRSVKKPKRGAVKILPSSQAPADLFVRSIPHKRGHWSGHIRVPVKFSGSISSLIGPEAVSSSVHKFQKQLEKSGIEGTLIQHESIHFSLSKYFSLQLGSIESFVKNLTSRLAVERFSMSSLVVDTSGIVLVNDEHTRSFYGWRVCPNPCLLRILQHVDDTLSSYNQPKYYDPPIFHISLASIAGDVSFVMNDNESDDDHHSSSSSSSDNNDDGDNDVPAALHLKLDEIQCKFGTTKQFSIRLHDN